jgi:hypothetical protein
MDCAIAATMLALLVAAAIPSLAHARRGGLTEQDASKQRSIHAAMVSHAARSPGGKLPTPGLINRLAVGAQQLPGEGDEDIRKNRTPYLYSACVAQQLFNTDILVGPTEVNQVVRVWATYNYAAYNPAQDTYWDGDVGNTAIPPGTLPPTVFRTPINAANGADECHASYSHLILIGIRKTVYWRGDAGSTRPIISTRGCKNGITSGDQFDRSPTLRLHGSPLSWEGNVCFGDNHVSLVDGFRTTAVSHACGSIATSPDNMFACAATTETKEFDQQGCLDRVGSSTSNWLGGDTMLGIHPGATSNITVFPQYDRRDNQ